MSKPIARRLAVGFFCAALATLLPLVAGKPDPLQPGPASSSSTDALAPGGALSFPEHVSANGAYQTSFEIPVPSAPAAPKLSLVYDSQANGTWIGAGWDLSVGWPITILRDVRFGTPQWNQSGSWIWGASPLVPANVPASGQCVPDPTNAMKLSGNCGFDYRLAPDALTSVHIDLAGGRERATVRMPNGTTLDYEAILYDGTSYPNAPAGAETQVFGFRLVSAVDHNGYRTCLRYRP